LRSVPPENYAEPGGAIFAGADFSAVLREAAGIAARDRFRSAELAGGGMCRIVPSNFCRDLSRIPMGP
jgi:hypothetical protein